jgi:hypothetical protein|nr:MAG TPA: hypothetical protein [Caudoviricetes sp.]
MTNREKYAERILDIAVTGHPFAINRNGEVNSCGKVPCDECIFRENKVTDISCGEKIKEWSEQEYVEPPVDWSKVPVDTKILVRVSEYEPWLKRHFARYENNIVFAWDSGCTSYSADGCDNVAGWKYVKLAEEDV